MASQREVMMPVRAQSPSLRQKVPHTLLNDAPQKPLNDGLASRFFSAPCADPSHAIVEVSGRPFPPTINGGDLLCVDFTHTRLTCDALYVIILSDDVSLDPWIGIRRFQRTAEGWVMSEDYSGRAPQPMTQREFQNMQIVGRVKQVFNAGGLSP